MKKIATYYFIVLAGANAWLAWFVPHLTNTMSQQYVRQFEGKPLPELTTVFLNASWWPYILIALCIIGIILCIATRLEDKSLLHIVILTVLIDAIILFYSSVAFAIPFISIYETFP
jgi:hypothetical protein